MRRLRARRLHSGFLPTAESGPLRKNRQIAAQHFPLPGGVKTRLPLLPFQMMGWRPPLVSDPPEVGQHNDEVLAEIGYDGEGIARLRSAGMLGPR